MQASGKAILTCALTGVLTDPRQHPVPVTPEQMAAAAPGDGKPVNFSELFFSRMAWTL